MSEVSNVMNRKLNEIYKRMCKCGEYMDMVYSGLEGMGWSYDDTLSGSGKDFYSKRIDGTNMTTVVGRSIHIRDGNGKKKAIDNVPHSAIYSLDCNLSEIDSVVTLINGML